MFLSMWILADWLKEYDPVTVIIEGKQNIAISLKQLRKTVLF